MVKGLCPVFCAGLHFPYFPGYPAQMACPETGKDSTPDLRSPVSRYEITYGGGVRISDQPEVKSLKPAYHTYCRILTDGEVP